jgi:integrase
MKIKDAVVWYLDEQNFTDTTLDTYRRILNRFGDFYPGHGLSDITSTACIRWVDTFVHRVAPATATLRIAVLKSFFEWMTGKNLIDENPASRLSKTYRLGSKPVRVEHWLEPFQVIEILNSCAMDLTGLRDRVVLQLGFNVGLRRQEIVDLTWGDIQILDHQATLVGKGGKLAKVHLPEATVNALQNWKAEYRAWITDRALDDMPVVVSMQRTTDFYGTDTITPRWGERATGKTVYRICQKLSKRAGIPFAPHDMRRTFAGLVHDRTSIETVSAALRHSSLAVTERYLEKRQDSAYQATKGLDLGY